MQALDTEVREQIDRILHSGTFQRSESLQRVLSYLTERSLTDGPDQLKEYAIGMDVFGKGKDYDTRLDSSVRIQVSRLRQKLIEYYAAEGVHDEIIVALPKGQFKLLFEHRVASTPVAPVPEPFELPAVDAVRSGEVRWRRVALALAVSLVAVIIFGSIPYIQSRRANQRIVSSNSRWTPAMEAFWRPFLGGDRPLVLAVGAPLFIGLRGCCFYRDPDSRRWDDAIQTQNFKALRKALGNPELFDGRSYTTVGQAKSLMLLGGLLGQRIPKILFAKSNELSWQQLSDNNALFIGSRNLFELLSALPVKQEIVMESTGLRVVHPGKGEPGFIPDGKIGSDGFIADGEDLHDLISILPGPNGKGIVGVFTGSLGAASFAATNTRAEGFAASMGAGSLPAVEYATNPATMEELYNRMRDKTGRIPAYFQVALGVKFKGGVPVSSHYLLSRELRLEHAGVSQKVEH